MPGLGLPQQPAPAQLLEVVHHRALADILQFLPNGDGRFRVESVRQQRAHGDELPQGALQEQAVAESQGRELREDQI